MLATADLRNIAAARLTDAAVLHAAHRYDCAVYVCGYAVECALKARIATTLNWAGFPETNNEFGPFRSFETHDLSALLKLTGMEQHIKINHQADWSEVTQWDPENRYKVVGMVGAPAAQNMLSAAVRLLAVL
jgi:hypothetical protein